MIQEISLTPFEQILILTHEEARRAIVLEDLVQGDEVLGELAVVRDQRGPGGLLRVGVLHHHCRAHRDGHVGGRVDDLVDLGRRKVVILFLNLSIRCIDRGFSQPSIFSEITFG